MREANGDQFYYAMLTVMNEYAEVMGFYFCTSKSLYELEEEMKLLQKRYTDSSQVSVVYTDNARADELFLKSVFGEHIQVKRDIFHVLNDYYKGCYKHPLRSWFMGDIRQAFFTDDLEDKEAVIRLLLQKHADELPLDVLADKDEKWFRRRIRKYIVDTDVIKKELQRVIERYKDFPGLFKTHMHVTHQSIIEQLVKGFLTDPSGENVYFDISNDNEEPKYITIRGTSQLESLHYHIQKVLSGPNCNEETLHLVLTDRLYRWNVAKGSVNRNMVDDLIYDPKVKSEIDLLRGKLHLKKKHNIPKTTLNEGFGILRSRYASEAYIASQTIRSQSRFNRTIECNSICLRKGILRDTKPISGRAEQALYKVLAENEESHEQIALQWNHIVLNALMNRNDYVSVFSNKREQEIHLPINELFLKDARHLSLFEDEIKKSQVVFRLFWNADHFKAFRLTRQRGKFVSGAGPAKKSEMLVFSTEEGGGFEESIGENNSIDLSITQTKNKKKKRNTNQCPGCTSATRRHISEKSRECEFYQYYTNRKRSHDAGVSLVYRQGKESLFQAIVCEYNT